MLAFVFPAEVAAHPDVGPAVGRRPVLRTPRSKVYHVPSGSASAGLGWPRSSQRSRKCCWQAERSERVTACHFAMNSWGVTANHQL